MNGAELPCSLDAYLDMYKCMLKVACGGLSVKFFAASGADLFLHDWYG